MEGLGCLGAHPLPHAHVMYLYLLSSNTHRLQTIHVCLGVGDISECVCTHTHMHMHIHTYIHKGPAMIWVVTAVCKTENIVGGLTFLLNETRGNQLDISIHPCNVGGADYILAPAELAVQLISLLCSYLLQLQDGSRMRVGCGN